jgi:hypothetical protein
VKTLLENISESMTSERLRSKLQTMTPDKRKKIEVPNPLPVPLPGGGPQDGYQFLFNTRYYETRNILLQPFFYGRPGAQPGSELMPADRTVLADTLYADKVDFDQQIDYWGAPDPYQAMFSRSQLYGYQREPVGTGSAPIVGVVTAADLQGPPVPGKYLLVTCDINLL